MKKVLTLLFIAGLSLPAICQQALYHFTEEFYFIKEVPVSHYQGKNFRYEIAVQSQPSDSLSKVRIHGIAVGKGREDFINSAYTLESRTEQDWTIYTIVGKVQPGAVKIWFYAAINGNGQFYFDDINCYIEEAPARWKQLTLLNPSFEESSDDIFKGYYVSKRKSPALQTMLTKSFVKSGNQALWVKTRGTEPVTITSMANNQ